MTFQMAWQLFSISFNNIFICWIEVIRFEVQFYMLDLCIPWLSVEWLKYNAFFIVWLQQALVGEGSGEEQLFSSESSSMKDGVSNELDCYLQKLA